MRALHCVILAGKRRYVVGFGLRAGYWPCLEAVFVELSVGIKRFGVWWGYASKPVSLTQSED